MSQYNATFGTTLTSNEFGGASLVNVIEHLGGHVVVSQSYACEFYELPLQVPKPRLVAELEKLSAVRPETLSIRQVVKWHMEAKTLLHPLTVLLIANKIDSACFGVGLTEVYHLLERSADTCQECVPEVFKEENLICDVYRGLKDGTSTLVASQALCDAMEFFNAKALDPCCRGAGMATGDELVAHFPSELLKKSPRTVTPHALASFLEFLTVFSVFDLTRMKSGAMHARIDEWFTKWLEAHPLVESSL